MKTLWTALGFWLAGCMMPVLACTCTLQSQEQAFRNADLVFEGKVQSSQLYSPDQIVSTPGVGSYTSSGREDVRQTVFTVSRPLKGRAQETRAILHSRPTGGNCGISFDQDASYRVYAYEGDGNYYTSMCTYSASFEPSDRYTEWESELRETILSNDSTIEQREEALEDYEYVAAGNHLQEVNERFFEEYERYLESLSEAEYASTLTYAIEHFEEWGDRENVAEAYVRLARMEPGAARFMIGAGEAFLVLQDWEKAAGYFKEALSIDPENLAAKRGIARTRLFTDGSFTEGVADYRNLEAEVLSISEGNAKSVDLSGSVLSEIDMAGAVIGRLNLMGATVSRVDFPGAVLRGAVFEGLDMRRGASFSAADLTGAVFRDVTIMPDPDFSGANLTDADFRGADLYGANFANVRFGKARLDGSRMRNAVFTGADLSNVELDEAELRAARIDCATRLPEGVDIRESLLVPVEVACNGVPQNRDFSGQAWEYSDFSGLALRNASFRKADLTGAEFYSSDLSDSDFSETEGYAAFGGADLSGASFRNSEVRSHFYINAYEVQDTGNLPPAVLQKTDFSGSTLVSRSFVDGYVPQGIAVDISEAIFDGAAIECDSEWKLHHIKRFEDGPDIRISVHEYETEEEYQALYDEMYIWEKDRYDDAVAWVEAEGELIRALYDMQPDMTFGEECQVYLTGTVSSAEGEK